MKSCIVGRLAGGLLVTLCLASNVIDAAAAPLTMNLDSSQSAITLSGSFNSIPLTPQGPGSTTASYSGSITVDVDNLISPTSIQFLGSSAIAANTGLWLPEAGGGPAAGNPGTGQSANYGLQLMGGALGNAFAALRNLSFNITSDPQTVVAGAFPATQSLNVSSGLFAFNLPPAFMSPPGQDDLTGDVLVNAAPTPATYAVAGSTATLTIPVNIVDTDDLTVVYSGQLVATARIPEPSTFALVLTALASAWAVSRRARCSSAGLV